MAPNRKPYPTKDGHVAALIYNDKHWNAFIDAVQPAWNSESYATLEQRAKQIDVMYGLIAQTLLERTTAEWLELFRELEIPAAPIQTPDELFDDPHLNAVGLFETVQTKHGPVRFPGVPTWFSRTPGRVAGPAPELGADTAEVLAEVDTLSERERGAVVDGVGDTPQVGLPGVGPDVARRSAPTGRPAAPRTAPDRPAHRPRREVLSRRAIRPSRPGRPTARSRPAPAADR